MTWFNFDTECGVKLPSASSQFHRTFGNVSDEEGKDLASGAERIVDHPQELTACAKVALWALAEDQQVLAIKQMPRRLIFSLAKDLVQQKAVAERSAPPEQKAKFLAAINQRKIKIAQVLFELNGSSLDEGEVFYPDGIGIKTNTHNKNKNFIVVTTGPAQKDDEAAMLYEFTGRGNNPPGVAPIQHMIRYYEESVPGGDIYKF
ncbi:hypothetical protein ACFL31_03865 [Candidatus Margulisiibacteriota bacterium]